MYRFLKVLCAAALIFWVFAYMYLSALACAFGNPNGTCRAKMPWQLNGEDFTFLIAVPGIIFVTLLLVTWAARPKGPPSK